MAAQPETFATPVRLQLGRVGLVFKLAACALALALVQVLLGDEVSNSLLMAGAAFFGLLAVLDAGVLTAIGILNLLLVGRILLGAFVVKNAFLLEPITGGMLAPETTSAVMFLGFSAVWLATVFVRRFVRPVPLFETVVRPDRLHALLWIVFAFGVVLAVVLKASSSSDDVAAGGLWGVAKALANTRSLALPILMLLLWNLGTRKWLLHPLVLLVGLVLFLMGVVSTSKQAMAEPILFYVVMAIARNGWRHPIAWIFVPISALVFQSFIYPIAQFSRSHGGQYKNPMVAAEAVSENVVDFVTNSSFREYVRNTETDGGHWDDGTAYLPKQWVSAGRVALVGEADRLISTSDVFQYTRWDTIVNSLLIAVPHFLYPQKPQQGSGNYLARYAGDLTEDDQTTQVSYGFMANAFNAFGMLYVLPLTWITALFTLLPVALITNGPAHRSPWAMFALVSLHQAYIESSFSGLFGAFNVFILAGILTVLSIILAWLFDQAGLFRLPRAIARTHGLPGSNRTVLP
jgi:hypothetical protein